MTYPAARLLKRLLPLGVLPACLWCRWQERRILKKGVALSRAEEVLARRAGVCEPGLVRLLKVRQVPPSLPLVRWVGHLLGFMSPHTIGMTLRYGIFIRADHWGEPRLLAHEFAHVAQYERRGGSFYAFLKPYVGECIDPGYPRGPLEKEAQAAEGLVEDVNDPE